MNIWNIILSTSIACIAEIYSIHRIVHKKVNFKSIKLYITYFLMVIFISLNYTYMNNLYKVLITLLLIVFLINFLFNKNIKKSIVIAVIMELTTIVAEILFSVTIVLVNNLDNQTFINLYQGQIISNVIISVIVVFISTFNIQNILYKKICKIIENISLNKTVLLLGMIIICSSFLFYMSYYNKNNFFNLVVNFLIVTAYFIIVIMIIIKESNYNRVYSKYITMVKELKEYENIINEYRIINHENKNQLLSIKGITKSKKVNDYINEIINNKNSNNKKLLDQALLIPTGGLRGLIYSKLIQMKDKNIDYNLNIDRKVNNKLMKKINSKEMIDICQIIGVFIDNAIEAVDNLDNKNVIINIYNEDSVVIEVINNYNNNIKLNRIDKVGYTTKGNNHGYGLALVNKLITKNKNFSNEREISKNVFKQKLVIKI